MKRILIVTIVFFSLLILVGCVSAPHQQSPLPSAPPKTITPESAPVAPIKEPSETQPEKEETEVPTHEPIPTIEPQETEVESHAESTPKERSFECTSDILFIVSPLDIDDVSSIVALGNLNPPGHVFPTDHIYFYITRTEGSDHPLVVPLYSPGNLTVTMVNASEHVNAGFTDYSISLQPCEHITVVLGHVSSLSTEIFGDTSSFKEWTLDNEYSTGGETYRRWRKEYNINVMAGQVLGSAGGNPGQWALDLGVYNLRHIQESVANSQRWLKSWYLHAVDPLSCFEKGPVLDQLLQLVDRELVEGDSLPYGSVLQDLPGAAQGCWFFSGVRDTYPEDPHLALVHSNIYPSRAVLSVGTSIPNLDSATYKFLPEDSGLVNRDFKEITPDGQIYGFQVDQFDGVIILQMPDAETLWIEALKGANSHPVSWSFSENKTTFKR